MQESSSGRYKKKLNGKSSWFKTKRTQGEEDDAQGRHGATRRTHGRKTQMTHGQVKTRSVLFVPQTPGGVLARNTKETLDRLEAVMGYKVKVVERAGTSLQNMFSQTSIWDGMDCGRGECVPCNQGGEERPNCTRTSVVYENICLACNPSATKKGELQEPGGSTPSLYVGESSRSV